MKKRTNADLTRYPKLYKNTYWGSFAETDRTSEVAKFRNTLANFFELKKYVNNSGRKPKGDLFDHIELYQTQKGSYIYFTSPYVSCDARALELGFTKLKKPFYSEVAFSYFKTFANKKEYNKFIKSLLIFQKSSVE